MKTFIALFFISAAFGVTTSIGYWFSSHDYGGTLLLGCMAIGLSFAGGYAIFAEKNANLEGDEERLQHKEAAGATLGIFTKESAWPILLALSIVWLLVGIVWSDFMIFTGVAAMLLVLWRLGAESARV